MLNNLQKITKLVGIVSMIGLVSACSVVGAKGTPQQLAQARAVHAFDENRAPFGQRIASGRAFYKPGVYGLNPYFGR